MSSLQSLALHRVITSVHDLEGIGKLGHSKLSKLDISHGSGIMGNLSLLLCQSFPWLKSLILSGCGLNLEDLCSLAQANAQGRLPKLSQLDLSDNSLHNVNDLFAQSCTWNQLLSLNIFGNHSHTMCVNLDEILASGCLCSLQELSLSISEAWNISTPWRSLQTLRVHYSDKILTDEEFLQSLVRAVEADLVSSLQTVLIGTEHVNTHFYYMEETKRTSRSQHHLHARNSRFPDPILLKH